MTLYNNRFGLPILTNLNPTNFDDAPSEVEALQQLSTHVSSIDPYLNSTLTENLYDLYDARAPVTLPEHQATSNEYMEVLEDLANGEVGDHSTRANTSHQMRRTESATTVTQSQRKNKRNRNPNEKRRLCEVERCTSQARAFRLCKRHGGSKRCTFAGCTRNVQSRGLCIRHGGGSRCHHENCTRAAQSRGLCKLHGGGRPCMVEGCTKKAHLKRLCRRHGGGAKCIVENCTKWAQKQSMCMSHAKEHNAFQINGRSEHPTSSSGKPPQAFSEIVTHEI